MSALADIRGAGLGLKRELMPALQAGVPACIDFFEVAPENWIGMGGRPGRQLARFAERYPLVAHGLSLSLGGPEPLIGLLRRCGLTTLTRPASEYGLGLTIGNAEARLLDLRWVRIGAGSLLAGRTIGEADVRTWLGVTIVGVVVEGRFNPTPGPDQVLRADAIVAVVGDRSHVDGFETAAG